MAKSYSEKPVAAGGSPGDPIDHVEVSFLGLPTKSYQLRRVKLLTGEDKTETDGRVRLALRGTRETHHEELFCDVLVHLLVFLTGYLIWSSTWSSMVRFWASVVSPRAAALSSWKM